jgi:hypothetical protein
VVFAFLLAVSALFTQAVPVLPNQGGTVSGVLRSVSGTPAAGVRVMALAQPEALKDLAAASSFAGLGETDATGRYRLENIPPGRYYIIAGRVDAPTFYPGTLQANSGTILTVAAGSMLSGIDFVLNNESAGRAVSSQGTGATWRVSLQTIIEGGGKVPLFGDRGFPELRFTRSGTQLAQTAVSLDETRVTLGPYSHRVSVVNLPQGYALKSLMVGPTDLRVADLQLPATNAAQVPFPQSIVVTLTTAPATSRPGVRIAGRIRENPKRSIHMSGSSGTIYSDSSFEFLGVRPGQHTIFTRVNPGSEGPLGATLVVGEQDILDVELQEVLVAPSDSTLAVAAGNRPVGTRIPLSAIRGHIADADTKEPFDAGRVVVNGNHSTSFPLNDGGRFEIPKLLPGNYDLEVFVFGVGSVKRTVVINGEDVSLDLSLGP